MRSASGIVLILVGLSVAVYALAEPSAPSLDRSGGPEANVATPFARIDASSSIPSQPIAPLPIVSAESRSTPEPGDKSTVRPTARSAEADPPKRKDIRYRGAVVAKPSVRTPVGQPLATNGRPLDRVALTRELQRQLHRVGCYGGSISGVWSPSTRQAMKEFTERVNATLPIAEPDHILLALLQSHGDQACGQGCGIGQSRSNNGHCQPNAIIARDSTKSQVGTLAPGTTAAVRIDPSAVEAEAAANRGPSQEGRMALAGPELGAELPPADPQATPPSADNRKDAQPKGHSTGSSRNAPNRRRQMGAWIFHDAPVDRLLGR